MVVCVKTSANYHKLRTLLESFLFLVLSTILHVFSDPFFPAILVWHLQFRILRIVFLLFIFVVADMCGGKNIRDTQRRVNCNNFSFSRRKVVV